MSLEEIAARKRAKLETFILDEKEHKSSKVKYIEDAKGVELTAEYLKTVPYDTLLKLVQYIK